MDKYIVYVDDNARSQDKSARYRLGEFGTFEEAAAACRKIVDEFFQKQKAGSFEKLWEQFTMFGEDPFIMSGDNKQNFSAWDYAKEICRKLSTSPLSP